MAGAASGVQSSKPCSTAWQAKGGVGKSRSAHLDLLGAGVVGVCAVVVRVQEGAGGAGGGGRGAAQQRDCAVSGQRYAGAAHAGGKGLLRRERLHACSASVLVHLQDCQEAAGTACTHCAVLCSAGVSVTVMLYRLTKTTNPRTLLLGMAPTLHSLLTGKARELQALCWLW